MNTILSITGSDSTGSAGVQADIRTIAALGGYAVTAITSIAVHDNEEILHIYDLPTDVIMAQVMTVIASSHPDAVKIGLLRDVETIRCLSKEIVVCHNIVLTPGMFSSQGVRLMGEESIVAWKRHLIPQASLLQMRCVEAEAFLGIKIETDDDMKSAAKAFCDMGAKYVLLRGGHQTDGRLTALLYGGGVCRFYSSQNTQGWQKHGVSGALSTAIATCLPIEKDISAAIERAHAYIHSQVVYSISTRKQCRRPADIYNQLMSLIADNYTHAHDVNFYAERLSITPRYLSQVTNKVVGKSPKQLISEYIINEAKTLLSTTLLPIQQVSNQLGFSSQSRFCKFFFQYAGSTPTEWRG